MILKNKALQIFDFSSAPADKLYDRAGRFYMKALQEVLEGKTAYDGEKLFVFSLFPEVAAGLGPQMLTHPLLSQSLRSEPMAALHLLLSDYSGLNAPLEPIVLTSAEATYYLLKVATEKKLALAKPLDTYIAVLLADPFWALRRQADTSDEGLLSRIVGLSKDPSASPGAAYMHLYFNTETDPADFVESLSASPMYAYLASRHFYDRGIEFKYFSLKGLTPRWAYHFITDGFLDDEEGLIETMLPSADWLVEYLVESERYKDIPYVTGLVQKSIGKAPQSPLVLHLQRWLERTTDHVKKTTPPPKPAKGENTAKTTS